MPPLPQAQQLGDLSLAQHTEAPLTGESQVQTFHGNWEAPQPRMPQATPLPSQHSPPPRTMRHCFPKGPDCRDATRRHIQTPSASRHCQQPAVPPGCLHCWRSARPSYHILNWTPPSVIQALSWEGAAPMAQLFHLTFRHSAGPRLIPGLLNCTDPPL